jgi:hypothetical protein
MAGDHEKKSPITHRCDGRHSPDGASCPAEKTVACAGFRRSDGSLEQTCGEPCSWSMGKAGHGLPPWTTLDGMRFDPSTPDAGVSD